MSAEQFVSSQQMIWEEKRIKQKNSHAPVKTLCLKPVSLWVNLEENDL